MRVLVTYDGTIQSKNILKYGIEKVKECGGKVTALFVFNNSMFVDYDAQPGVADMARKEALRYVEEGRAILSEAGGGVTTEMVFEEGVPEEEIIRHAGEGNYDVIFAIPKYKSILRKSPCPVSVVPGYILVPVDNSESVMTIIEKVIGESKATGSKVVLLGIVPVHLYSKGEKDELGKITRETTQVVNKAKKRLKEENIETKELISSGYPDEEILKAAEEFSVAMIMIPDGGDTPSELGKAATVILDEPEKMKRPVLVVQH